LVVSKETTMADAKQRPDAADQRNEVPDGKKAGKRPDNQAHESRGNLKGEQVTDDITPERWDTKRGAETSTRGASGPRH
jgi:hypothetical protein